MAIKDALDQFVLLLKGTHIEVVGYVVSFWEMFWYFTALSLLVWLVWHFLES